MNRNIMTSLKILPKYFESILKGTKTFEIRFNDRDYLAGDQIRLREYDTHSPDINLYTGRFVDVIVVEVFKDCIGVLPGYVIMSIEKV